MKSTGGQDRTVQHHLMGAQVKAISAEVYSFTPVAAQTLAQAIR